MTEIDRKTRLRLIGVDATPSVSDRCRRDVSRLPSRHVGAAMAVDETTVTPILTDLVSGDSNNGSWAAPAAAPSLPGCTRFMTYSGVATPPVLGSAWLLLDE